MVWLEFGVSDTLTQHGGVIVGSGFISHNALLPDCDCVSDLNEAIPETELLDNSIQKGRAQLSVKARRHRPSRSRYRDSVSSTEGDDSLERKVQRDEDQSVLRARQTPIMHLDSILSPG